jgi:hypothetical protein
MQNHISDFHKNEFKVALVYLEQWEVLGYSHYVPWDGGYDSPEVDLSCKGSLGFLDDWFIRPVKGRNLLSLVRDKSQSKYTSKRRSSLKSLSYLERRDIDRIIPTSFRRWSVYLSDYLA